MVYCGKPSKGCAPCRAKRTKCDQARPYCGQCRRVHRDCPGYRDEHDTWFRNETSKVVAKIKTGAPNGSSKPVTSMPQRGRVRDGVIPNTVTDFPIPPPQMVERITVAIRSLTVPLEDAATNYFFRQFLSEDPSVPVSHGSSNAYGRLLPTLYRQDSSFGVLPNIIDALGLASISNVKRSPELMVLAGQKYSEVLRGINASIQDPTKASTDQTLMAIMLLGLYETVTCSDPESMRSWANHISGATAIARLRGVDQLRTDIGRTIFALLRIQILIDCLQRRLIIPTDIIEWAEIAAAAATEETRPEHQLFPIIGRLCALRATAERSHSTSIGVITLANSIDTDLEEWKDSLPPAFSFSIVQSASTDCIFSNTYHVYNSTWAVVVWNVYRCARILTQQVITDWLSRNSMPTPALEQLQRRRSEVLLAKLAHDICASAPFILGASQSAMYSSRSPSAATGTGLLWPLYLAATMDGQMRAWVITRLELIGRTMGIKQAESLAIVLSTQEEITAWDRFETVRADEELDDW